MKKIAVALSFVFVLATVIVPRPAFAEELGLKLCVDTMSIKTTKEVFSVVPPCVDVQAVSFGISRGDEGGSTGAAREGGTVANFSEVAVSKLVDPVYSPWLISSALAGGVWDLVKITGKVFELHLFDVVVTSITTSASVGGAPTEIVTFAFGSQKVFFPPG